MHQKRNLNEFLIFTTSKKLRLKELNENLKKCVSPM